MRSVYFKTLYDKRFFVLGWAIGLAMLSALMVVFYPAMRQDGSLDALVQSMPEAFKGLIGNLSDLTQFDTYLASQLFDVRVSLIVGIMAIILGLGLSVADEEKGELRTLLSLPISRTKVLMQKWLAMVTILLITLLGLVAGIYLLMPFIDGASLTFEQLLRLVGMTALMTVAFGTIPFAIGFATGRRAVAMLVSTLVIIGSFILSTFGQAVDWLSDYERFSLLHYFPAVEIVKGVIDHSNYVILGSLTVMLLLIALLCFRRRDVG